MATRMQQRRGTLADWTAENPVLMDGEIGFETDTHMIRVGDGVTPYLSLPMYVGPQGLQGPNGPVGAQGPQGNPGSQGPVGAVGPAGPQGPAGAQGPAGPAGSAGAQGPAGPAGTSPRVAGALLTAGVPLGTNADVAVTGWNDFVITVPAGGARYRMVAEIQCQSTVADDNLTVRLRDGGATTAPVAGSTVIYVGRKRTSPTANVAQAVNVTIEFDLTAGTHHLGVWGLTVNGSGTIGSGSAGFISSVAFDKVT